MSYLSKHFSLSKAKSPLKKNGNKKKNKKYQDLANLLNVDTTKDTIIGPSKSLKFAQQKGHFYGPRKDSQSIKNKGNIEYYTIHKKIK